MVQNSANVRVYQTGELSYGLTSATAPTGTASALTGFTGLGLVSTDGFTEARDRSTNDIRSFQGGAVVRTVVTESGATIACVLLETTKDTVGVFYGTTVTQTVTEGSYTVNPSTTGGRRSFVLDLVDGSNLKRMYIPQGEVTETDDITYTNGDAVQYGITISMYPDSTLGGTYRVWETALHS